MDYVAVKEYILERLWNELPDNLFYHGVHHTTSVIEAAELIVNKSSISQKDLILLKTAALCHDFGFIYQYSNNESIACDKIEEILPKFSYDAVDIKTIKNLIMATQIPQNPNNYLEEIICDADLFYLGTDEFTAISNTLRNELLSENIRFTDVEWLEFQLNFVEKHKYFTKYGKDVLCKTKQKNIDKLHLALEAIK